MLPKTGEAAMQAHIVLAHPEPLSFNAHLAGLARRTLEAKGWQVTSADLLIPQYPMWWHLAPAMLRGWIDRVSVHGAVYSRAKRFEAGRLLGKRAMLSVTVGTSAETYAHDGRSGDIDLLLWPVGFSLAYVG